MMWGRWGTVPRNLLASLAVDPFDPYVVSSYPKYLDPEMTSIPFVVESLENEAFECIWQHSIDTALCGLENWMGLIGWKLYIPYGDNMECEIFGAMEIKHKNAGEDPNAYLMHSELEREYGCFGVLASNGGGVTQSTTQERISGSSEGTLVNILVGRISTMFADVQISASQRLRLLGLKPSNTNPLVWVDEFGYPLVWFERFLFLTRDKFSMKAYYMQPQLWRWVCNWSQLKKRITLNGFEVETTGQINNGFDPLKTKQDQYDKRRMSLPFRIG